MHFSLKSPVGHPLVPKPVWLRSNLLYLLCYEKQIHTFSKQETFKMHFNNLTDCRKYFNASVTVLQPYNYPVCFREICRVRHPCPRLTAWIVNNLDVHMLQLCRVLLNSRLASRFLWCLSPVRLSLCLTTMLHQTRGPNWDPQCARRQWEVYVPSVTGATKATLTIPTCPGGSKGTGTSLFSSDAKLRFPHMNTSWVHVHTYTKHKIGIHMRKSTKTRACKKVT